MHSDDGIVLRLPDTDGEVPGAELAVFEPDEIEALVTAEVGGSALFASRFRECAARSLLLPRRDPRRRTPLWQQRQRANQLLQVGGRVRRLPGRARGDARVPAGRLRRARPGRADARPRIAHGASSSRSRRRPPRRSPGRCCSATSACSSTRATRRWPSGARRRSALDPALLAELLGATELRELLDADALAEVEREIARLRRRPAGADGIDAVHDLLRSVGDLTHRRGDRPRRDRAGPRRRSRRPGAPSGCASPASSAGSPSRTPAGCATRSAWRCRSACPRRSPSRSPTRSAIWCRATRAPTARSTPPTSPPASASASRSSTPRWRGWPRPDGWQGELPSESRRALPRWPRRTATERSLEWCDAEVLRTVRRRSLAALRKEVEPVPPSALARFIPAWQGVGARSARGVDGVLRAVEQLAGVPRARPRALESLVLPGRVADYAPAMLDELTSAGEVVWTGAGSLAGQRRLGRARARRARRRCCSRPPNRRVATPARLLRRRARAGQRDVLPRARRPVPRRVRRRRRRPPSGTWSGPVR